MRIITLKICVLWDLCFAAFIGKTRIEMCLTDAAQKYAKNVHVASLLENILLRCVDVCCRILSSIASNALNRHFLSKHANGIADHSICPISYWICRLAIHEPLFHGWSMYSKEQLYSKEHKKYWTTQIILYFLHSTLALSFYIDVVFALSTNQSERVEATHLKIETRALIQYKDDILPV